MEHAQPYLNNILKNGKGALGRRDGHKAAMTELSERTYYLRFANQIYIEVIWNRVAPRSVNNRSRVIRLLVNLDRILNF